MAETLRELAGYPEVSATAFQITHPPILSQIDSVSLEADKKVFVKTFINKFRVVGCLDSGSDLTIMHESLYLKLFKSKKWLQESQITEITTFSDTSIQVLGCIKSKIKLSYSHSGILTVIYVIKDVSNQTPWLVGNDFLRAGLGALSYIESDTGPEPQLKMYKPEYVLCTVYYEAPRALKFCKAYYKLEPKEFANVEFQLPSAAQVIRTDEILITARKFEYIDVFASRDVLEYNEKLDCFTANARI